MISLKEADMDDSVFLFELRNEESTRMMSNDTNPVQWKDHVAWLTDKLSRNDFKIYVALDDEKNKIGQFRIDHHGVVGVSLSDKYKNKGYGWQIIKMASEKTINLIPKELVAEIKIENIASEKSFKKAGYEYKENFNRNGQEYYRLVFKQ